MLDLDKPPIYTCRDEIRNIMWIDQVRLCENHCTCYLLVLLHVVLDQCDSMLYVV